MSPTDVGEAGKKRVFVVVVVSCLFCFLLWGTLQGENMGRPEGEQNWVYDVKIPKKLILKEKKRKEKKARRKGREASGKIWGNSIHHKRLCPQGSLKAMGRVTPARDERARETLSLYQEFDSPLNRVEVGGMAPASNRYETLVELERL